MAIDFPTLTVRSTRGRLTAGCFRSFRYDLLQGAGAARIAGVSLQTVAYRTMVLHHALGVQATHPGARIATLVIHACLRLVAVSILHAFRPATCVRVAEVLRHACARTGSVSLLAYRVGTAR